MKSELIENCTRKLTANNCVGKLVIDNITNSVYRVEDVVNNSTPPQIIVICLYAAQEYAYVGPFKISFTQKDFFERFSIFTGKVVLSNGN